MLVNSEETAIIDFDDEDKDVRFEYRKALFAAGIFFTGITTADFYVLNQIQVARRASIAKKLFAVNLMNIPFYAYFYYDIKQKHAIVTKHLVKKYLIHEGQRVFN